MDAYFELQRECRRAAQEHRAPQVYEISAEGWLTPTVIAAPNLWAAVETAYDRVAAMLADPAYASEYTGPIVAIAVDLQTNETERRTLGRVA